MTDIRLRHKPIVGAITIVIIAALINIASHIYFSESLSSQNQLSRELSAVKNQQELIKQLYGEIGYGGFIHNFKNLLLRGDLDKYVPRLEQNIIKIRSLLIKLKSLQTDDKNSENYKIISSTFENYFSKYGILKEKIKKEEDIKSIDESIKIDDEPALQAINSINKHLSEKNTLLRNKAIQLESNTRRLANLSNILLLVCIVLATYMIFRYQSHLNRKYLEAERAKEIIESSDIGVWELDLRNMASTWNEVTANIHEVDKDYKITPEKGILFFKEGESRDSITKAFNDAVSQGVKYDIELPFVTAKGNDKWVRSVGIPVIKDGKVIKVYGTFRDITKRKKDEMLLKENQIKLDKANEELLKLSYLDPLTKIPNRRAFEERLASEINSAKRSKEPISLLMIDVDKFKEYNDTYGHKKGDMALYAVAQKIKESLPRATDFVARYGGEELVVILPSTTQDGAVLVSERIINSVTNSNIEHSKSTFSKLTVSIGIASTNKWFDELSASADKALYKAKENGRNRHETYDVKASHG